MSAGNFPVWTEGLPPTATPHRDSTKARTKEGLGQGKDYADPKVLNVRQTRKHKGTKAEGWGWPSGKCTRKREAPSRCQTLLRIIKSTSAEHLPLKPCSCAVHNLHNCAWQPYPHK